MLEYAIMVGLIAAISVATVATVGTDVKAYFTKIHTTMDANK